VETPGGESASGAYAPDPDDEDEDCFVMGTDLVKLNTQILKYMSLDLSNTGRNLQRR
jgi:hypothetical protein